MTNITPPNAGALVNAFDSAINDQIDRIAVANIYQQWNPETCPLNLLPWLAWAVSVDEWNPNWTEPQKRQVISESLAVHRTKGTSFALQRTIGALDAEIEVKEGGVNDAPHSLVASLDISKTGSTVQQHEEVVRMINRSKNARSYLSGITLVSQIDAPFSAAATCLFRTDISLRPEQLEDE